MTRDEFWNMHPVELWWRMDHMRSQRTYGKGATAMTEAEVAEIYADVFSDG